MTTENYNAPRARTPLRPEYEVEMDMRAAKRAMRWSVNHPVDGSGCPRHIRRAIKVYRSLPAATKQEIARQHMANTRLRKRRA